MFGKKSSSKLETLVGAESEVHGELAVKGTIRIDGLVDGNINADWVIVGETGTVAGNIRARGAVVGGRVTGNIDAEKIVELKAKARFAGEIRTPSLTVAEGAVFEGQSRMRTENDDANGAGGQVIPLNPTSAGT
jgi:cytoskeletal protein CcmA (bactofilin family)